MSQTNKTNSNRITELWLIAVLHVCIRFAIIILNLHPMFSFICISMHCLLLCANSPSNKGMSPIMKVPLYTILGTSVAFALTFSVVDLVNYILGFLQVCGVVPSCEPFVTFCLTYICQVDYCMLTALKHTDRFQLSVAADTLIYVLQVVWCANILSIRPCACMCVYFCLCFSLAFLNFSHSQRYGS